jgi:hypothetical protein
MPGSRAEEELLDVLIVVDDGSIDDFPLRAFIIADLLYVFWISSAVEIEPEERTVAGTLILLGVEKRAGSLDAAFYTPVATGWIVRPCGFNPDP